MDFQTIIVLLQNRLITLEQAHKTAYASGDMENYIAIEKQIIKTRESIEGNIEAMKKYENSL